MNLSLEACRMAIEWWEKHKVMEIPSCHAIGDPLLCEYICEPGEEEPAFIVKAREAVEAASIEDSVRRFGESVVDWVERQNAARKPVTLTIPNPAYEPPKDAP